MFVGSFAKPLLTAMALSVMLLGRAQAPPILMDGLFADWALVGDPLVDATTPSGGQDLLRLKASNDATHLFLQIELGGEIDLLDDLVPQTVRLYIDADNNAATGLSVRAGFGAELQVRFDTRTVTEYIGGTSNVPWRTIDLTSLPTTTSTRFEIALSRNAVPDGTNVLFTSNTIKILFRESDGGDEMPDAGGVFTYTFQAPPAPPPVIPVERASDDLVRTVAWNVLGDGLTDPLRQPAFQRLLTAMAPDVIGFSECVSATAAQVKVLLDQWLPMGGTGWQVVKDDFDMVTASRWPIVQSWPALSRQFPVLIDLPSWYTSDLLFTSAHLNCCTADATRQAQCDAFVQFIQDARTPGGVVDVPIGTVLVHAGDLNTVGWVQQLETLITGDIQNNATYGPDGPMDWDGTGLARASCRQTEGRMAYTWRNPNGSYPSGILDHFLFSDASAQLAASFALRTEVMAPERLDACGLNADDTGTASDHFPLVADLQVPVLRTSLTVRVVLQGPLVVTEGLMHDSLRQQGLVPLVEPYTDLGFWRAGASGEATTGAVLANNGPQAAVDWLMLELRDAASPSAILATRCALLRRDGVVMMGSGDTIIRFDHPPGIYHVGVRHRNHFGAMTAQPFVFGPMPVSLDLRDPALPLFGNEAMRTVDGVRQLWTGNAVQDGELKYTGAGNDRDALLTRIGGVVPTAVVQGYWLEDLDLDGRVKYTGSGNDRDIVLLNIGGVIPTAVRTEQLP
jgi:hypothetical protein